MTIQNNNQKYLSLLSDYLNFFDKAITKQDIDFVKETGVSEEQAFCFLLASHFNLDPYGKDKSFFYDYFLPSVKMLDVDQYYNDLYFKLISFQGQTIGNSTLKYMTYAPYQGFVRDDFLYMPDGRVIPLIGFFATEYKYPAVLTDGREWMTLLPNEINSQKPYIKEAFGKVLTYGLGLGYYVLHASLKPEVTKVDVVDVNDNVINLFNNYILPKFPESCRKKIKVIKCDAFLYAKNLTSNAYDYIYADIWHDVEDGIDMYLKFKELEMFCPTAKYGYWIENSIKYYL